MAVPHITSCCWCLSVRTGTKLIAYMHLAFSLSFGMICLIMAAEAHGYIGTVEDAEDRLYTTWFIITLVVALVSVVHVFLAVTLIYGVSMRRTGAVRAWVCGMAALLAGALLAAVLSCAVHGFRSSGSEIFLYFVLGVVLFAFIGYCILCVYSFFLMLRSSEDAQGPTKPDY